MQDELAQDWFFTFGCCSYHHANYIKIYGTYEEARDRMFELFGRHWAFQYASAEEAGVVEFALKELQ